MDDKIIEENKRLRAALDYIALLAYRQNPHLGRPRLTDKKCIFCMAYFALNNGAYGENISKDDYKKMARDLRFGKERKELK